MKKILAVSSVLLASTSFANADTYPDTYVASEYDPYANFYVGGDLGYTKMSYDDSTIDSSAEDSLPMMNIYAGYNFSNDYAVEVGTFLTSEEDKSTAGGTTDTKEYGMYIDAIAKYHMYENFSLLGSLGIQYSKLKVSGGGINLDEKEVAPRIGLGAEYGFNENMKVRGMARYVFADYDGAASDSMHYTLGLNYTF